MKVPGHTHRMLLSGAAMACFMALVGGAMTLPFFFESPSLFYKFGVDKGLLRAGKMVGLAAAVLMLAQLVTAAGGKPLDRLLSLPGLYSVHRLSAYVIGMLVLIHPVLVFLPDGMLMIPLETRYWPEWIGAALLLLVLAQVVLGRWRGLVFKRYQKWRTVHRLAGAAAIVLLIVHILYVSETFEQDGLPRNIVLCSAGVMALLWIWMRLRGPLLRKPFTITRVEAAGDNATTLTLAPGTHKPMRFLPGQFAFVSVRDKTLSKEAHPFTIASSPSRPQNLQFTIRGRGDWTSGISRLRVGQRVYVHGAFGRFSHLFAPRGCDLLMIAGGIGITPMLSMLRYMRDTGDNRRIFLLWSNRTRRHLFAEQELAELENELTGFKWVPIFTRTQDPKKRSGRMDRGRLKDLLRHHNRDAAVFLCGPPLMMDQMRKDLKAIGYPARHIHIESFGF